MFRTLKSMRACRIGCCGFCAYRSPTGLIRQWQQKSRRRVQRVIGGFNRSEIARLLHLSARAVTFNVGDRSLLLPTRARSLLKLAAAFRRPGSRYVPRGDVGAQAFDACWLTARDLVDGSQGSPAR